MMIEPTMLLRSFLFAALCLMMVIVFVCLVRALKIADEKKVALRVLAKLCLNSFDAHFTKRHVCDACVCLCDVALGHAVADDCDSMFHFILL